MSEKARVILLRRDKLSSSEEKMLQKVFADQELEYHRTDPVDYKEHLRDCERIKPVAVVLPLEKPIPSAAMEKGFCHILIEEGKDIVQLESIIPRFTIFAPNQQ